MIQKNQKCCDNLIKKETKKKKYMDNYVHAKIDPKLQKMSKTWVLNIIIHEGLRENIQGGFIRFQKKFISYILIRVIVR